MSAAELDAVLREADRFARNELAPRAAALDLEPERAPVDVVQALRGAGLLPTPELDEALLRPANALALLGVLSARCAGIGALQAYALAGEMLRRRLAPGLACAGPIALALQEEAAPELDEARTGFETVLEGGAVTGRKRSVRLADRADVLAVFARGSGGDHVAWVRRGEGVRVGAAAGLLGTRALGAFDVAFERAPVLASQPIQFADTAWLVALLGLFTAECACATAQAALDAARAYAAERWQGGRLIAQHDALRLLDVPAAARLSSARAALAGAAHEEGPRATLAWLRARLPAVECAVQAASDAIQTHGGYGYMRDYGVEKRFRDAVSLSLLPLDDTRLALLVARLEAAAAAS